MVARPMVIVGAGRSGTNVLREVLCSFPGFSTWPCDEINYIWRHGNRGAPTDELTPDDARPEVVSVCAPRLRPPATPLGRRCGRGEDVRDDPAGRLRTPHRPRGALRRHRPRRARCHRLGDAAVDGRAGPALPRAQGPLRPARRPALLRAALCPRPTGSLRHPRSAAEYVGAALRRLGRGGPRAPARRGVRPAVGALHRDRRRRSWRQSIPSRCTGCATRTSSPRRRRRWPGWRTSSRSPRRTSRRCRS